MTAAPLLLARTGLHGRRRLGVVTTFVILVLAAIGIAAGLVVSRQGAPLLDEAADGADVAHLVLYGDPAAIERVAADPEVVAWSGPLPTLFDVELLAGDEIVPMKLTELDDPDIEVNHPPMKSGRWAASDQEIVLDRSLGADLGIAVGDDVTLRWGADSVTFEVVGTAVDFTDCLYPQCEPGRAWVTGAGLTRFGAGELRTAQGWLRFDDPAQADGFVERNAAAGVEGITGTESWLDTRDDFLTLDRVFGSFVAAFGVFVLAVAAVIVAGSTAMRVVARRREIGLLGAVGCTPGQITRGLLLEHVLIGVVAGMVGWFLGGLLAPSLQIGIGLTLGTQDPTWTLLGLAVTVGTIGVLLVLATLVPAVSAARRPVTDVLRDVPRDRVSWLNRRAAHVPSQLSMLGVRELAGKPTRAMLAALAIVVAVVGVLVSIGFVGGIEAVADDPARAGDPWDVAVVRGETPADEVEAALAADPAVGSWFGEVEQRSTLDEGAFLSVAMADGEGTADFHIAGGRAIEGPGEAIAGFGFLERFDRSVGDEVRILVGTTPLSLRIVGWYRETEDSGEVLRYGLDTLRAAEPGVAADVYRVTAADGVAPQAVASSLAEQLGPSVRTEILDTGVEDMRPMMTVMRLVAAVLLLMAGVNLLVTLLTSNREAAARVGVQVAVGFTPRQVTAQGAVAGAALGVGAALVGVPLGLWVFTVLGDVVSEGLGVGPGWMPSPSALTVAVLAVAAIAVAAGLGALAVARIARQPASDLVRME
jgi:putative ABC transport system permease protein